MKTMPRKGFFLGCASAFLLALSARTLPAAPPRNGSSGGDDDLEDLEIQRRTMPPRYNRRYATTLKWGSGQTTVYPNEDALRYSDEDWSKGRVVGRIEMVDPDHDSTLGSGTFVFVSKLYQDDITLGCYDEQEKKFISVSVVKPLTTKGTAKPSGKPQIKDLITVEIVDPKGEIERGRGETCAPAEGKRKVKVCISILGKRYCAEVQPAR